MTTGKNLLTGLRFTVIGANGFLGVNLCLELISQGASVIGCGRTDKPRIEIFEKVNWHQIDITENFDLSSILCDTDYVVHLVSTMLPAQSNKNFAKDIEENLLSTIRIIKQCETYQIKKIIFASSGGTIYGPRVSSPTSELELTRPICSYGIVKNTIEQYLSLQRHLCGQDYVSLRIANPYGPFQKSREQGLVAALIGKVIANQSIEIWGDGKVVRDYIYVNDVVDAVLQAVQLTDHDAPRVYNIGSGQGHSVNEVIDSIGSIHGSLPRVSYAPERPTDVPVSVLDISLAKQFLSWAPRTVWTDGLQKTYQYFCDISS